MKWDVATSAKKSRAFCKSLSSGTLLTYDILGFGLTQGSHMTVTVTLRPHFKVSRPARTCTTPLMRYMKASPTRGKQALASPPPELQEAGLFPSHPPQTNRCRPRSGSRPRARSGRSSGTRCANFPIHPARPELPARPLANRGQARPVLLR